MLLKYFHFCFIYLPFSVIILTHRTDLINWLKYFSNNLQEFDLFWTSNMFKIAY